MPPLLPRVGVARTKYVRGLSALARPEVVEFLDVVELSAALETPWQTDAHFVAYAVTGEESWPRLRKSALPSIKAVGQDVIMTMLVFDIDNPGHARWSTLTYAAVEGFRARVDALPGVLAGWTALYPTSAGARLIYVLEEPLAAEEAEAVHRGMVQMISAAGLAADPACSDWTRLFRLPFVVREIEGQDRATWTPGLLPRGIPMEIRPEVRLTAEDVARLPRVMRRSRASAAPLTDDMPAPEEGTALLKRGAAHARKALEGRETFAAIFKGAGLAVDGGSRHDAIVSAAGQVVALLAPHGWASPGLCFALLSSPVTALGDERDFLGELWRVICDFWPRELAKVAAREEERAEARRFVEAITRRAQGREGDKASPFAPEALAALRLVRAEEPGAWATARVELKRAGISLRDLEREMGPLASPEQTTDEGQGDEDDESLLDALTTDIDLWHDPDGVPFATFEREGHQETCAVNAKAFRLLLGARFYGTTRKAAPDRWLTNAIDSLAARARFDGPEAPVFLRLGHHKGRLYLDLGDETWRAVEIDPEGWRVVARPPVRFRRGEAMRALPEPVEGGSLADLWPLVNVPEPQRPLVAGWLLGCLAPRRPYPFLVVTGEQGSAKSTLVRALRELVDPARGGLRALPRDERDLVIAAQHARVLAFDNVSAGQMSPWTADALCRLATGGAIGTRTLYSNAEETVLDVACPVAINGIDGLTNRADLAERSMVLDLPTIAADTRRAETDLDAALEAVRPGVLGALLTAVAAALGGFEAAREDLRGRLPRMADLAAWVTAGEEALGFERGTFLRAFEVGRRHSDLAALEAEPVAVALVDFMEQRPGSGIWQGSASQLRDVLGRVAGLEATRSRAWPASGSGLARVLKRCAPLLRQVGIEITSGRSHAGRHWVVTRDGARQQRDASRDVQPLTPQARDVRDASSFLFQAGKRKREEEAGNGETKGVVGKKGFVRGIA